MFLLLEILARKWGNNQAISSHCSRLHKAPEEDRNREATELSKCSYENSLEAGLVAYNCNHWGIASDTNNLDLTPPFKKVCK